MTKTIFFYLAAIFFLGCENSKSQRSDKRILNSLNNKELEVLFYKEYEFKLKDGQFGFKSPDFGEPGDGINSLAFTDKFIFLTDGVLKDVKRVNVTTGEVKRSAKLSDWPNDIEICNGSLFVMGRDTSLIILNFDLSMINKYYLKAGEKYFYKDSLSALYAYYPSDDSLINIKCANGKVSNFASTQSIRITGLNKTRNKDYKILSEKGNNYIVTKYGKLALRTPYDDVYRLYNSINIDFNAEMLVCFSIDQDTFKLNIYKYR
jgi:hypothetical protein